MSNNVRWVKTVDIFGGLGLEYFGGGVLPNGGEPSQWTDPPISRLWLTLHINCQHCGGSGIRTKKDSGTKLYSLLKFKI